MTVPIGKIRIGISNGQIPGNKKAFPKEFQLKSRLHYYSQFFNTIEINKSFYITPLRSTYEKWVADVPEDFQFSIKLSKDVSHHPNLAAGISSIESFMQAAAGIGVKKGCLLIQFPGKINIEHFVQVQHLLEQVQMSDPLGEWRLAVEFRHESWYIRETEELLDEFNATLVIHDFSKAKLKEKMSNSNFVYLRFHGPAGNYRGSYAEKFLEEKSKQIRSFSESGLDVYAYFNNTAGNAFENAKFLSLMLSQ
ncbi:MAG: DUF72 domain-containing protein [Bacteroidetes bacterium]|nr:MAG: DUF72 domain-containing protein [Bacteroidota bacterium]